MSDENTVREDAPTSREERFFGKKHIIDDVLAENEKADEEARKEPEIAVETVDEGEGGIVDEPDENPPEKETKSKTGDDELDSYSEKVQKRINRLTWEREEANRKLQESEAIRQEAIRYAQVVNEQNQQQANIIATGEARLVEQIKNRAALAVEAATNRYRAAYESGDTDAIIQAQKELTIAQAEQLESYNYEQDYNARRNNWIAQQQAQAQYRQMAAQRPVAQQQPQPQRQAVKPTPQSQNWAQKNPWFGHEKHRDMTALAYAEHERLVRDEGIQPDTDEYYAKIDAKVRQLFPDYFAAQGGGAPNAGKPNTVVAPGNRNNGGKPRTVRLEPHQVALAKQLGLTPEQYARQVLKESKNG